VREATRDFMDNVGHMRKRELPGQFEQVILTAVLTLGEDAYGVSVFRRAQALVAPRSVSIGAVYVTLDRMETKGYLTSWLSEPTHERGGRAKRRYRLAASGETALRESVETGRRIREAVAAASALEARQTIEATPDEETV
jgi:DNA-binding PadR family transcriptional regulator